MSRNKYLEAFDLQKDLLRQGLKDTIQLLVNDLDLPITKVSFRVITETTKQSESCVNMWRNLSFKAGDVEIHEMSAVWDDKLDELQEFMSDNVDLLPVGEHVFVSDRTQLAK